MTTIHSIRINTNPLLQNGRNVRATRTSKSRQYGACLVGTVSVAVVERVAQELVNHEAKIAELQPVVENLLATWGKTLQEVEAIHEAAKTPWYTALFAAEAAYRDARRGRQGGFYSLTPADREAIKAQIIAQGAVDPYAQKESTFLLVQRQLETAQYGAARIKAQNLTAGQQLVISWHRDAGLARQAMGSGNAQWYVSKGYTLEIRTDIEVTTK